MAAVTELAVDVGTSAACHTLLVPRASYYRARRAASFPVVRVLRPSPLRALQPAERETVLAHLHAERFQDRSPAAVYATLLDEGEYHCSIRTMYRLLEQHGESRERRDQLLHPPYQKPELMATAPNQLWSWDISKLLGPAKWTYFYLYVILDVFSRYVTGWMVAYRESAVLAQRLIEESCKKQYIQPGQLTLHADRGTSMRSKPVALLLADLQNGGAHIEAINKEFAKGLFDYWKDRSEKNAQVLLDWLLTIEGTKWHYLHGVSDPSKISPDNWVIDQAYQGQKPGNKEIQLSILYNAKRDLDVYADWQEYFRKQQPPTLITWGKNDGIFTVEGAELYKRDIPMQAPSSRHGPFRVGRWIGLVR